MSTSFRKALPFVAAAIVLCACQPQAEFEQTDDDAINAFFESVFERELAESPVRQSMLGRRTDRLGEWDDFSDESAAARVDRTRNDLETLRREFDYEKLSDDAKLSYDVFVFNAERDIANSEFHRHQYVVDQFNGQLTELITVLQNNHPIGSVADAEDYISRIEGLEKVLDEFTRQLGDRADFGVIAPAFSFPDVLTDASSMSTGFPITDRPPANTVYADFQAKLAGLDLGPAETAALTDRAAEALRGPFSRGFSGLITRIEQLGSRAEGNRGVWSLPDGEAYYQNRIRHHTTLELTADEIHATGLADVARIHDEMRGIMEEVGFDGTLREFFDFIREDENNYYEDSDAGREQFLVEARGLVDDIYAVVGDWFNRLPQASLEVRRVEPWRENSTSIAFYDRPSEDGSRPGIYYANLADMQSVQRYVFTAITYHESVPGHHFQIALAQELEGMPDFRKYSGYGAFVEGWALYAERLAKEMGFYADPYHDFGRLQNELWRSVRLVLDTGIHAKRWTREQSIDYFRENTPLSEGDIVTEVERFFVNPGQALGYKIGMMKILELRSRAEAQLGPRYDIRAFHDAVIGAGPLPLSLLETRVERYIREAKPD